MPIYEIRVRGRLDAERWAEWFDEMTVSVETAGSSCLRGPVADQAALFGVLARLRDLALPLLSVRLVDGDAS